MMNTKLIRSILLAVIGSVSIFLGLNAENSEIIYNGDYYDANGVVKGGIHLAASDKGRPTLFILGGAVLIVCAIPTNLKKKED